MSVTYATAAALGFDRLVANYKTCVENGVFAADFWHGANALQTCIDYLVRRNLPDKDYILGTADGVFGRFAQKHPLWWRDDYGWWGNAFMSAPANRIHLGYFDRGYDIFFNRLLRHSLDGWGLLNAAWSDQPYGPWDNTTDDAGKLPGGVFNEPLGEPASDSMVRGRNSVTNEGYWLLCQGLGALFPDSPFAQEAERMKKWFAAWLSQKSGGLLDPRGLVRERPGGIYDAPNWCWTGDQGLLYRALMNAGEAEAAGGIAKAVITNLTDTNGILQDDQNMALALQGYFIDYAAGKGVLLRNLLVPGEPAPAEPVARCIKASAAAVWLTRQANNQFVYSWSGKEPGLPGGDDGNLVAQASGQDALNAALLITLDEEIPGS
jgi:hypothetical protein